MVDCVSCGTKEQGVPMGRHGLVCTGSQSKDSIWGHVTCTWASFKVIREHHNGGDGHSDVIPPLEEWDINLEVSSQVY